MASDRHAGEPKCLKGMDLCGAIKGVGLDDKYWLHVLQQYSGISQLSQLNGITSSQIETLKTKSRMYLEFVTLRSLIYQHNQRKCSETIDPVKENENILIEVLGLEKYFPSKISLKAIIAITNNSLNNEPISDLKMVPWAMLQRFVMIDYKGRDDVLNDYVSNESNTKSETDGVDKDDDDPFGDLDDVVSDIKGLNPLDVFLLLFYCCDPMLKQILVGKLFVCKLAVPFIYSDPFSGGLCLSLWPLRSITLEFKSNESDASEISVAKHGINTCAFVRVGRPKFSKSKIMNEILNENAHHTFFNKDCPLGMPDRYISRGYVEASWYIPSQKSNDGLKNLMTFLNLRGDAALLKSQLDALCFFSNIVVVVIDLSQLESQIHAEAIERMMKNDTPTIFILCVTPDEFQKAGKSWESFTKTKPFDRRMNAVIVTVNSKTKKERNTVEMANEIRKKLISFTSKESLKNLESLAEEGILKGYFATDEQLQKCIEGWSRSNNMLSEIDRIDGNIKAIAVPLQGETWYKLTELQKKKFKAGQKMSGEDIIMLEEEIRNVRKKQKDQTINMSKEMKQFIHTLIEKIDDSVFIHFFITWLKLGLDERSRNIIPKLRQEYNNLWIENVKCRKNISTELRKRTEQAESDLANASFGLEHLVRELGQIYEATVQVSERSDNNDSILKLPETVAKLLMLGYPFEIMDGDAANVPLGWLKSVFSCLQNKLKGKKTLALSVLGIQSSGKSTLLNTMFGLQFAVSAGRCTRGVFIQLVPVHNLSKELPFDYVIVIDTEGLRAPELSNNKYDHDNELATLVIGLGDITIINVKGENTAEVEDVLQIVVHAFLRMKLANRKLDLHRSCVFLHQNVAAVNAESKMQHGVHKLVEKLNEMTREAASQEKIDSIQSFNDVINFDVDRNVWYFSDLWHGDPPMAPSNPGYSYNVKRVRKCLLNDLAMKKGTFLSIDDTLDHIKALWEGILTDDFVFSFRNSLEVKAYNTLEVEFQKITWEFEEEVHKWMIENVDQRLKNCPTPDQLTNVFSSLVNDLNKDCNKMTEKLYERLDLFFRDSDLKDVLEQWHQNRKFRLRTKVEDILKRNEADIKERKDQYNVILQTNSTQTNLEKEINKRAKYLAKKHREQHPSNQELEDIFKEVWQTWVQDLTVDTSPKDASIDWQVQKALYDCMQESEKSFVTTELEKSNLFGSHQRPPLEGSIKVSDIEKDHLRIKTHINIGLAKLWEKDDFSSCAQQAAEKVNVFLASMDMELCKITDCDQKFSPSFIRIILKKLFKDIEQHNQDKTVTFIFLPVFKVKLAAHICRVSLNSFIDMDERYQKIHSVRAKLQEYKEFAKTLFVDTVGNKTDEVKAANFLSKQFEMLVAEEVQRIIPCKIEGNITQQFSTKFRLLAQVMDDLLDKNSFLHFRIYLLSEVDYVQSWIKDYTIKTIIENKGGDGKSLFETWANGHISTLIGIIKTKLEEATSQTEMGGIQQWLNILEKELKDTIPLTAGAFHHVLQFDKVQDLKNLESLVEEKLVEVENELKKTFAMQDASSIYSRNISLNENIFKRIWGCTASCPFCNEPCQRALENHTGEDHMCIQHRPEAVNGWSKVTSEKTSN